MKECQHCKNCFSDEVIVCPNDGMPTVHTIAGEPILEGKYQLESRVGQGGMGVVYKARHAYLKTIHAIKVILPDLVGNDPQLVQRFQQEALAAAAIRHQNVVNVTDYGVAQGTMPFLVMEYVEGEDLHELLAREGKLAPEIAFEYVRSICAGIGVAHKQGIVHRDLKPLNIMILRDRGSISESVKILDFGLAKIKSGELLGSFIQAQTTGLMGSPYYMAPEQWADDDLDSSSDIYSIGVMLFQMITGDVPFKGSSIPAIMKKHLTDPPPTFAELGLDLSPELEAVVRKTLEKERNDRTSSVEELVEGLALATGKSAQQTMSGSQAILPSDIRVLTNPPNASVYLNDVSVGVSKTDGWLLLEGIQSGNHILRVSHDGFKDFQSSIFCDGTTKEIVAKLNSLVEPQKASAETLVFDQSVSGNTPVNMGVTQGSPAEGAKTLVQNNETGRELTHETQSPATEVTKEKSWYFSPIIFAVSGISVLLLLIAITGAGVYFSGILSGRQANSIETPNDETPTNKNSEPKKTEKISATMVGIPGGTFSMGRNDGLPAEQPEHQVTLKPFEMDKTEVTNGEYYEFVKETGHNAPPHFVNGKPVKGKEKFPVNFVSLNDALEFAKWRSKRDGKTYRLPTEEEWEYAARNGSDDLVYPWGNQFDSAAANIDKKRDAPDAVGSFPKGGNKWGVQDLIGNVWEWTNSPGKEYPNSSVGISPGSQVVRGGGFFDLSKGDNAITSTFRGFLKPTSVDKSLGFRLVISDN
ncbi:MAG: SUMF1/EgtB/PvdO family nonheme iron enzyme [Pyrinomonadaceae bacterium]